MENFKLDLKGFYENNILSYVENLQNHPINLIMLIIDLIIVIFLLVNSFKIVKNTRMWQLIKGIFFLIIATWISGIFKLTILNYILTAVMNWGVLALIVIFQPELRRGLEQLGTSKFTRFFGLDKSIEVKTKENIYKISIAATELSSTKTGALIVIERDIKINDIIETGIVMDAEISPQLLVNIFVPRTPLHDGAVVISDHKIAAASCMLPLADDKDIAKELGTRHRAAIGISKETDSIVVVVSEETGKISIAKDGTLIADVKEETLKKILIKYLITARNMGTISETKEKLKLKKKKVKIESEEKK
ncbi:MAG: diadenylate cyclase CdaA [Clostridia bacterium]|nr:diadenylate cyclase CdaA [Clostridia bacterium]